MMEYIIPLIIIVRRNNNKAILCYLESECEVNYLLLQSLEVLLNNTLLQVAVCIQISGYDNILRIGIQTRISP